MLLKGKCNYRNQNDQRTNKFILSQYGHLILWAAGGFICQGNGSAGSSSSSLLCSLANKRVVKKIVGQLHVRRSGQERGRFSFPRLWLSGFRIRRGIRVSISHLRVWGTTRGRAGTWILLQAQVCFLHNTRNSECNTRDLFESKVRSKAKASHGRWKVRGLVVEWQGGKKILSRK